MDHQLNFEEAEILDSLIFKLIDQGGLKYNELPKLDNTNRNNHETYEYYFKRLQNDGLIEISGYYSSYDVYPVETLTNKFFNNGGYKRIYEVQQMEYKHQKEINELTLKKLRWDSKLSKWQANTFWYVFIFGIIGGICGVISLLLNLYK